MERQEAIHRLTDIVNQDLRPLAEQYKVPVFFKENGSKNNIWPSQVLERHLGLYLNSSRSPSFWSWELKVIPLKYLKSGNLTVTRAMSITIIDTYNLKSIVKSRQIMTSSEKRSRHKGFLLFLVKWEYTFNPKQ